MRQCKNPACGNRLPSTNAAYCRQCYRKGFRVRDRKPRAVKIEPLLHWNIRRTA